MFCRKDDPVSVKAVGWVQQEQNECCGGTGHNGSILLRAKFMTMHKDLRPSLESFVWF